ncbi:hypothetical protein [Rubritalea tangerina]|uniref:hypothetical protein n=1 Tax=Rubritalea tangerina TaxID=430798 RepID=UPI0036245775
MRVKFHLGTQFPTYEYTKLTADPEVKTEPLEYRLLSLIMILQSLLTNNSTGTLCLLCSKSYYETQ